jgi:FkbM family methyltransferase
MVAYDVGANCGYFSLVLSKLVGSSGKVFAFEADARNLAALKANVARNAVTNVEVIGKAVSHNSGQVQFASFGYSLVGHIVERDGGADASVQTVDAISLNDFASAEVGRAPDFIKIDVEGAEEAVFAGAREVLARYHPVVAAEIRESAWQPISAWMKMNGYAIDWLDGGWQMEQDGLTDAVFLPG